MDSIDLLARKIAELHKANRNPPSVAPRVGVVLKENPLEIQWGESIILKGDKLHVPKGAVYTIGDKVTIIPDDNLKMFFVINILA
jgi:hypothetical protein